MATVSGNKDKVGVRQNDDKDGKPKKIRRVTKKASAQDISQSSSKGSENDKEANPRKKQLRKVMTKRIGDEL